MDSKNRDRSGSALRERARSFGARLLTLEDSEYPRSLRFIYDPPSHLYVRGRIVPEDAQAIAVVGARSASPYGLATAEALSRDLAESGITVVSGLAIGIDGAAHRGALRAGGRTIAVLGCGIDTVYPARHRRLAEEIAEHGAVVSEFPLGAPPYAFHFPRRNRIVSGLSLGVVVVEAGERSGSLITARLAAEQGREVMAVPGPIDSYRTRGTHRLLREGAALVERGADVMETALPWLLEKAGETVQTVRPSGELSPEKVKLIGCFDGPAAHVDQLIEKSGFGAARVLELLLEMEIAGWVTQHPGKYFSRRRP